MAKKRTKKNEVCYVADFETRSEPIPEYPDTDVSVWCWGMNTVGEEDNFIHGGEIESFFSELFLMTVNGIDPKIYFHNLAFDGDFILHYLMTHGFSHVSTDDKLKDYQFKTIISDTGIWYSIEYKINGRTVTFKDSYKLLMFSVKAMAKAFGLKMTKGEIDYNLPRHYNWEITEEELDYLKRDVLIVAKSLHRFREMTGCQGDTIASCALDWYTREILGGGAFKIGEKSYADKKKGLKKRGQLFPELDRDVDKFCRSAYHGGFTYVNPKFKGENKVAKFIGSKKDQSLRKKIGIDTPDRTGTVLDVNSLYPSVMASEKCVYPVGEPLYFSGKVEPTEDYPIVFQKLSCSFYLKDNKIPSVQIKHDRRFKPTEYIEDTNEEIVELTMNNIDLERFFDSYEVEDLKWEGAMCFQGMTGKELFGDYVNHWMKMKIDGKKEKNPVKTACAKLFLNSLYGRFAKATLVMDNIPVFKEGQVKFEKSDEYEQETFSYVPLGACITSYAREVTLSGASIVYDYFIYSDTDSLHIALSEEEIRKAYPMFHMHETELGAWGIESAFKIDDLNIYAGAKRYLESVTESFYDDYNGIVDKEGRHYHCACCGLPTTCYGEITDYINQGKNPLAPGTEYFSKLMKKRVKGGTLLYEGKFKMKENIFTRF